MKYTTLKRISAHDVACFYDNFKWVKSRYVGTCPKCSYAGTCAITPTGDDFIIYCHACQGEHLFTFVLNDMANNANLPKTDRARDWDSAKNEPKPNQKEWAQKIWAATHPIVGSKAMGYLNNRRLLPHGKALPPSLRCHSNLKHINGGNYPTMVASVTDWQGNQHGIHRTYLQQDGKSKAEITPAKMSLGPIAGGSVHLSPAAQTLGVCEGIETGLAIQRLYDEPVWACLSTAGLENIILPPLPMAETVFIFMDHDANHAGQNAGQRLAQRLHFEGRSYVFMVPNTVGWDYADVLYHQ